MKDLDKAEQYFNVVQGEYDKLKIVCEENGLDYEEIKKACKSRDVYKVIAMIQSEEFKKYPKLFTKTVIANGNLKDIKEMLSSEEFKRFPKLFTPAVLTYSTIEKIRTIINSKEFEEHPELFSANTLAHGSLANIRELLDSEEYKTHPELFSPEVLLYTTAEKIKELLSSEEYKRHSDLFTPSIIARYRSVDKIRSIIESEEFKQYPELFSPETLRAGNMEKIIEMMHSQEFIEIMQDESQNASSKSHGKLFTSTNLAHGDIDSFRAILNLPGVKDGKYRHLITSTILAKGKKMVEKLPIQFELAEKYGFADSMKVKYLLKSPSENYAYIQYLIEKGIPFIDEEGKLHSIFDWTPKQLEAAMGVTREELMDKYPFEFISQKKQDENNIENEQETYTDNVKETDSNIQVLDEQEELSIEQLQEQLEMLRKKNKEKEDILLRQQLLREIAKEQQRGLELDAQIKEAKDKTK